MPLRSMRKAASVSDYRALARAGLPHFLFEYLDGGSYDEVTLKRNLEDLRSVALRQRVLRDVSDIDLGTSLFSRRGRSFGSCALVPALFRQGPRLRRADDRNGTGRVLRRPRPDGRPC